MKALSLLFAIILFPFIMADAFSQVQPNDTDGNGRINISTLDHLRWMTENSSCWGQDFELDNDINAYDTRSWNNGAGWSPIGSSATPFTGDFDGNGYSISGLYRLNSYTGDDTLYFGFFGRTLNNTIENLKLNNVRYYTSASSYSSPATYIGGVVAKAENSNIFNLSLSYGEIEPYSTNSENLYLGGLIGYASNSNVSYCNSNIPLNGQGRLRTYVGGLIGHFSGNTVSHCYFNNNIECSYNNFGADIDLKVGGLIGVNENGKIEYCYVNSNSIICYGGDPTLVGGLVGENQDSILNCYSKVNQIYASAKGVYRSKAYAGGISGLNSKFISNSYAVIKRIETRTEAIYNGYCYMGGIAGDNYTNGVIESCIYNSEVYSSTYDGNNSGNNNQTVIARNTAEMKTDTTYINNGWDFATVWIIDSTQNDGYPSFIKIDNNAVCKLEISYPNTTNTALYKDFVLEIKTNKGNIYKRNTTLNPSYAISGFSVKDTCTVRLLNKYNDTLGIINNVPIQEGINSTQFANLLMPYTVRLNAKDQKGNMLNKNISVKWFDVSNNFLLESDSIKTVIAGKKLKYLIEPNINFKHSLAFPDTLEYIVQNGANNITVQLDSLRLVTISGTIRDAKDSSTIKKATVSISQTIGVQNSENQLVKTDSNGVFSAKIYTGSADISISYNGYLNKSIAIDTITTSRILGNIYLSEINGATLDLSMSYTYAFKAGDSLLKNDYYTNWQDLDFEIFNISKNKAIRDYQLQFPTFVILDTNAAKKDSIRIIATNRNNEFKSKFGAARLDSNLYANIQLDFIQNGSVKLNYSSTQNDKDVALVYNSNGKLLKQYKYSSNGYVQTEALPEGTYKIVSMGYSDFFNDIQDINDLSGSGLVVNTDYLLNQVTVSEGTIAEQSVEDIPFFNESKLYYTGAGTLVSVNKTEAVVGSYFTVKTRINFKSEYADQVSNIKLIYDLPDNCPFVGGSAMIGRRTDVALIDNEGRANIQLPNNFNYSDEVRFCILPTISGIYTPSVFIQFDLNGKTIKQPLGIVSIKATDIDFSVANKTAQKNITALGIVYPNSDVIVYDNEVEVGRTKSLANGSWKLSFELNKPYSYSYHDIYAKIFTPLDLEMKTIKNNITYDATWIEVSKVTMIYNNSTLEFDFLNPSTKSSSYTFVPSKQDFTFKIDFTQNDPEKVTDVVVNAITAIGKEFPLKATYDQTAKCWIATGKFDSYNLPVNVSVGYDGVYSKGEFDVDCFLDEQKEFELLLFNAGIKIDNLFVFKKETDTDRSVTMSIYSKKDLSNKLYSFKTEILDPTQFNSKPPEADGFSKSKSTEGDDCFTKNEKDTLGNSKEFLINKTKKYAICNSMSIPDYTKPNQLNPYVDFVSDLVPVLSELKMGLKNDRMLKSMLANQEVLSTKAFYISNYLIPSKCKTGKFKLSPSNLVEAYNMLSSIKAFDYLNEMKSSYNRYLTRTGLLSIASYGIAKFKIAEKGLDFLNKLIFNQTRIEALRKILTKQIIVPSIFTKDMNELIGDRMGSSLEAGLIKTSELPANMDLEEYIAYEYRDRLIALEHLEQWIQLNQECPNEENEPQNYASNLPTPSNNPNSNPVLDPSGYVYEAVSSNLLPGVTTTCYYKTQEEDMYGDMQEVIKLWDAENYEQQNPLTTDEKGFYAWDVPQGQWQVKYEKDGYNTVYSEWLPVPPPQLDVNQGMTSAVAPEVKSAKGYESRIKVEFTKYMQIDSLNSNNITLVNKKDSLLKGAILLINQEVTPGNSMVTYASKLNYVPENELAVGDTVFLKIKSDVKSYANIPMDNEYRQMIIIRAEPKTIEAPAIINLASNGKDSITVIVTPAIAASGQKLKAKSGSNALVSITPNEITLDSTGIAKFEVNANLSGTTYITFLLDEAELRAETKVNIGMPTPKLTMPKASIDSGTTVRAGTELVLTSREFDSKIYYTLDGTSPVTSSSRILYDNPFNMNKNTVVKAYNLKDGFINSDIAVFGYKVINVYNITTTVNPDSAGTVTGAGEYYENQKVELILKKNKDFVFKNWTIDNQEVSTDTIYTFIATKNCHVVANFVGAVNSTSLLSPINNAYRITVKPEFTWQSVQEAEHYELQIAEDPYFLHKIIDTNLLTTKYVIPNDLSKNTSYFWKVRVWSKNNSSSWSPIWSFTTEDPADVEESKSIFSISPQPVRDEAIITFNLNNINSGISIELYDIKGTQTAEYKFTSLNEGSNKLRLDLSNIPSGMYNVIIKIGANIHRTKLLKIE